MKIEATEAILKKVRAYAEPFDAHPPALHAFFPCRESPSSSSSSSSSPDEGGTLFPFAADSDRGLGILLLAAALHRPVAGSAEGAFGREAADVTAGLYRHFGTDVFRLNRVPFDALRARVEELVPSMDPEERARIPGILRSVCDFFYRVGPLTSWLEDAPDWEQRAGELSQEIYWMGARSRTRAKARLFFWLACAVAGFDARPAAAARAARFAWPVSDGHMRFWFDILKPPYRGSARGGAAGGSSAARSIAPEARIEGYADFARLAFPDAPWRLYQPLEAFLKPDGRGGYRCRAVQGGCRPCPLSDSCPAARHFLSGEAPAARDDSSARAADGAGRPGQ